MPQRADIKRILIIGAGPIVIGQACEFDYSGTQACKALRELGYETILVNSNPATIMTDPEMATRTYIEPLQCDIVAKIIEKERPDAVLPTLGGQTGLNLAMELARAGVFKKFGVEMIGANETAIAKAEDRQLFAEAMQKVGLDTLRSATVTTMAEARAIKEKIGLPLVIRPAYTLGGTGGGIVETEEEFELVAQKGLDASPISQVLIEESIAGWKEYELEVMRDSADNVIIICSIENLDPMGVHTGDSITVAPAQTLTDKEYQRMRDASIAIIREIGVATGGSNIQFATHPDTGRMVAIEMNPRVSRSSALASKATGFPIAKIAAKLAVGMTLDEIPNDITRKTPACFEPTIDYVVTKIPRFAFEKFPDADNRLGTQMKSVGEAMAIGRTFKESFNQAMRSLEIRRDGYGGDGRDKVDGSLTREQITERLKKPAPSRIFYVRHALKNGFTEAEVHDITKIDPWFIRNLADLLAMEGEIAAHKDLSTVTAADMKRFKAHGFSDRQIAYLLATTDKQVRERRKALKIQPVFKMVDTCAAEFAAFTPYYYSTYEDESDLQLSPKKKIMILGGGPNRIGQGIEFDYCCVHAAMAAQELGYEAIMVNSNPETVSTDYDTSDILFFEPLTLEDVLHINDAVKPDGVIVQFGGQTPLNLAAGLKAAGVKIIGTSPESIAAAEDRNQFSALLDKLKLNQAPGGTATNMADAVKTAKKIGLPVLVRPSFVLGGRAMVIVHQESELEGFLRKAFDAFPDAPVLIDKFLDHAYEIDVDAVCDGKDVIIAGVLEHIEQAGVHSGDAAMCLPPHSLNKKIIQKLKDQTRALALALNVVGLMNVQFAVQDDVVYVLEVNPRASRTVPFVAKATGRAYAKIATKVMCGISLKEQHIEGEINPPYYAIKESVFPFVKFPGQDITLGPEMKSTGEVMSVDPQFGPAFMKAQIAAGGMLPRSRVSHGAHGKKIPERQAKVFISVSDLDKPKAVDIARRLVKLGYALVATAGTHAVLAKAGIAAGKIGKISEGGPNMLDMVRTGEIDLIINTPTGRGKAYDETKVRTAAVRHGLPIITTIASADAAVQGLEATQHAMPDVFCLQDLHKQIRK
ncbi:MAG TPA: carbamoyl-phosphate synthase large subunit [Planctomycetota bacterium]|nr:carbamoyl-phosphate synthase large subunit [Planctomycetota bacterium]